MALIQSAQISGHWKVAVNTTTNIGLFYDMWISLPDENLSTELNRCICRDVMEVMKFVFM